MSDQIVTPVSEEKLLPETGFIRLPTVLKLIPVSRSTWLAGIKSGTFPKQIKISKRLVAWRVEDIRSVIENLEMSKPFEK